MTAAISAFVLGGSGFVAGELLRLLAGHPYFALSAVLSTSRPGEPVARVFPHLASAYPEVSFSSYGELGERLAQMRQCALFSAAPHGASARLIDALLEKARAAGTTARVVDLSADFRYRSAQAFSAVYPHAHGAPARLADFTCALPEHLQSLQSAHVAHPGCFATAALLASVPLIALNLTTPRLVVSGVTGSTGSGREPAEGTHHPLRHSDFYAYSALSHRHTPEIAGCIRDVCGIDTDIAFVPHSGPFARGIHVTVQAELSAALDSAAVLAALRSFYAAAPFVRVLDVMPRIKDVIASNYAHLSAVAHARSVAVLCVIDNLTKGAAGGAVQWMNRLFGLPETTGLTAAAPGWT